MKKILTVLFSMFLSIAAVSFLTACNDGDTPPLGPVVEIHTEDDLFAVANNLSGNYKLMNDITLTKNWRTVGTDAKPFAGALDGGGHTLKNVTVQSDILSVDDTSIEYMVGLFGVLKGNITNLKVDGFNITVNSSVINQSDYASLKAANPSVTDFDIHVGLVGVNKGNIEKVTLTNVDFNVTPDTSTARVRMGGIAGKNNDKIEDCAIFGAMDIINMDGYVRAGGVAGYVSSQGKVKDSNANVTLSATMTGGAKMNLGGLVGNIECGTVQNCYSKGSITATTTGSKATLAGGLIGTIDNSDTAKYEDMVVTVKNCLSSVGVTVNGNKGHAAGLIGRVEFNAAVNLTDNACSGAVNGINSYGFIGEIIYIGPSMDDNVTPEKLSDYASYLSITGNKSVVADEFATQVAASEVVLPA